MKLKIKGKFSGKLNAYGNGRKVKGQIEIHGKRLGSLVTCGRYHPMIACGCNGVGSTKVPI